MVRPRGALAPPSPGPPGWSKKYIIVTYFRQIVCFCPLPWKSLRTAMVKGDEHATFHTINETSVCEEFSFAIIDEEIS